ncbi:MAG: spore germination protein GerW family protein [Clostridia bacterium]|nr:spore germination protein GerW family protein [Clostridia bacterium]MDD3232162.1 spore germination protein GerW family protein [Clostridia bacterium]MDD3862762.1 spore germination protein GerW family protein [Clostridia bacterium]MDD4408951.1 spore germination protein GerW family protein [Clostridia bacterium]
MKEFCQDSKSVEDLIEKTMKNLHCLIETNTVIGEPFFAPDGSIIIPISKVSVGYVVGGGEYSDIALKRKNRSYPLAGGSGGGMSISPVGFLIENKDGINYIDIETKDAYQSALNLFNKIVDKLCGEKKDEK